MAAPYVDTAVAFGRAAGLEAAWLTNLFRFAPRPRDRRIVHTSPARAWKVRDGFVAFGCEHMAGMSTGPARRRMAAATAAQLRTPSSRGRATRSRR